MAVLVFHVFVNLIFSRVIHEYNFYKSDTVITWTVAKITVKVTEAVQSNFNSQWEKLQLLMTFNIFCQTDNSSTFALYKG